MTFHRSLSIAFIFCAVIALAFAKVRISNKGDREGIFVLKGTNGAWLEFTDDVFPEEADRLLWGQPFDWFEESIETGNCTPADKPCLSFEWHTRAGRGFIKTVYPDGKKLLICLGRFIDSNSRIPARGLFLGGNISPEDPDSQLFNRDESGMTYYDGRRYFHIWCNVNEALYAADQAMQPIFPSAWDFLGSRVLESGQRGSPCKAATGLPPEQALLTLQKLSVTAPETRI